MEIDGNWELAYKADDKKLLEVETDEDESTEILKLTSKVDDNKMGLDDGGEANLPKEAGGSGMVARDDESCERFAALRITL